MLRELPRELIPAFGGIPPPSEGFRLGADGNRTSASSVSHSLTFGGIPPRSGWKPRADGRPPRTQCATFGGIPPRSGWKHVVPLGMDTEPDDLRRDSASERMETTALPGLLDHDLLRRDSASERMETLERRHTLPGSSSFGGIPPRSGWKQLPHIARADGASDRLRRDSASEWVLELAGRIEYCRPRTQGARSQRAPPRVRYPVAHTVTMMR